MLEPKWGRDLGLTHFSMLRSLSLRMSLPPHACGLLSRLPISLQSLKIITQHAPKQASTSAQLWESATPSSEALVFTLVVDRMFSRRAHVSHM